MMISEQLLQTSWAYLEFIALDLEGTGTQHKENEGIVEIAAIAIERKQITGKYFYKLINPEIQIPPLISKIHGLKNADLINEPVFSTIEPDLFSFINNKILVGHNISVDYKLLKKKIPAYFPAYVIDTMKLSKHFYKTETKHSLDSLIERFDIEKLLSELPVKRGRHSAFYDAFASALAFIKIIQDNFAPNVRLQKIVDIGKVSTVSNTQQELF